MALQIEQSAGACSSHQDLRAGHRQRWKTIYFCFVIVAVCLSFAAAFQIGVDRGFRDSLGKESYGRILFAVGAAITRAHGGYGYSFSSVIETILSFGGITGDATILKDLGMKFPDNLSNTTLVNAAIDKALTFKWPFDPDKDVRGSAGDDLGIVDYVRLGFLLFGYKVQSLYYVYFVILGAAVAAFLYAFRDRPSMLALLAIACAAQVFLFTSSLFDSINAISAAEPSSIAIADPRFLSSLAIIPGLHLGSLMLTNPRLIRRQIAPAVLQSIILTFAVSIRVTALWVIMAMAALTTLFAVAAIGSRRFQLSRFWIFPLLLAVWLAHMLFVSLSLHPAYRERGEITHHVFWHSVFYQLQFHPQWNEKYAAQFDGAAYDELPPVAAKKYLLRHPPADPDAVYFTPDRKYLRVAAAETFIRKAYFEFFYNDPKFALESLFIYNPISMYGVLTGFLSSLNQNSVLHYAGLLALFLVTAGFLASSRSEFRSFAAGTLLVVGGFIVSLAPIMLTVPGMRTMGDQYDMLLITLSSITVLALASLMRSAVLLTGRRA